MRCQFVVNSVFSDFPGIKPVSLGTPWKLGYTSPKGENLIALSKLLQCSPDWLLTGKDPVKLERPKQESNAVWVGGLDLWDSNTELGEDEVELPFFTEVELSAGSGTFQVVENHGPKLRFAKSTLKRLSVDKDSAACVTVSGNSMEPVLPDGSTVGVDSSVTTIKDGCMYAIDHNGMLRVKMLYRVPGGGIRLKSFNSDEHPDESYSTEEARDIRIIGRVFWYSVLLPKS